LRLIKILKTSTQNPNTGKPTSTPSPEEKPTGGPVVGELSNLAALLELNRADPQKVQKLVSGGCKPWQFISWLLYCASPAGRGVENPVGFSLRKLEARSAEGAGSAYDRLAQRPRELPGLVRRVLAREWVGDEDWSLVMAGAEEVKLRRLAEELGIERKWDADERG